MAAATSPRSTQPQSPLAAPTTAAATAPTTTQQDTMTAADLKSHPSLSVRNLYHYSHHLFTQILAPEFNSHAAKQLLTSHPQLEPETVRELLHATSTVYKHNMQDELAQTAVEHKLIQRLALLDAAVRAHPHYDASEANNTAPMPLADASLAFAETSQQATLERIEAQQAALDKENDELVQRIEQMRAQRTDAQQRLQALDAHTKAIQSTLQAAEARH